MYISSNKDRSVLMATYLIENNSTVRKVEAIWEPHPLQ